MGIPTLIKTLTASNDSSLAFVDGTSDVTLDSTYDEYMFVFTDMNPVTDGVGFQFQVNAAGASGYNETITSTFFRAYHNEDDSGTPALAYSTGDDQSQGTNYQFISSDGQLGSDTDESLAGILHLFSPASTTYVTHFHSTTNLCAGGTANNMVAYTAGYFNATEAIDEISFQMSSGNMDGVIQMYGIS